MPYTMPCVPRHRNVQPWATLESTPCCQSSNRQVRSHLACCDYTVSISSSLREMIKRNTDTTTTPEPMAREQLAVETQTKGVWCAMRGVHTVCILEGCKLQHQWQQPGYHTVGSCEKTPCRARAILRASTFRVQDALLSYGTLTYRVHGTEYTVRYGMDDKGPRARSLLHPTLQSSQLQAFLWVADLYWVDTRRRADRQDNERGRGACDVNAPERFLMMATPA